MFLVALLSAFLYASFGLRFLLRDTSGWSLVAGLVIAVLLLVTIGRALPLALSSRFDAEESRLIGSLAGLLTFAVAPFSLVVSAVSRLVSVLVSAPPQHVELDVNGNGSDRPERDSHGDDDIEDDEHEMISGILGMEEDTVREIMVPRPDVIAVPVEMSVVDVVEVARQAGHSRIPVYQESIDRIVGLVYAKDLLRFVKEDARDARLEDQIRPAFFVPESKRVDELLRDLKVAKVHIAIVVDEYGGTAGLVTIEDILEEIVGEIQDEYDRESPLFERVAPGEAIVDGRMNVEELAELFDADFAKDENGTVGGFVQRRLGHIPEAGETIYADGFTIEVQMVENHRVRKVRVAYDPERDAVADLSAQGT
jgi:putative hemolysin